MSMAEELKCSRLSVSRHGDGGDGLVSSTNVSGCAESNSDSGGPIAVPRNRRGFVGLVWACNQRMQWNGEGREGEK